MANEWDVVSSAPAAGDPWAVVAHEPHEAAAPKDYDPTPASGVPEGFHEIRTNGKPYIVHDTTARDIINQLGDLPGVGMAERLGQGAVRLGGKAVSGIAGLLGADPKAIQQNVNEATELPPSNDPLVQGMQLAERGASAVAAPVDRAVSNLPAGPRTAIEATEEAIPDIASLLGARTAAPEAAATTNIARSVPEVAEAAGYTGLKTKADLSAPGNQAITDALISRDAGIVPGQRPSVASLENAVKVGPAKVYRQAEASLPPRLTHDPELRADLSNLPQQVSQLPRSPDVEALQETMLSQPEFSRDELFANIREARERAKAHWKSDDPDKAALGDAYHALAGAYEDFAGRKLEEVGSPVSLEDWQAARTQMAKNYQARGALRGPQGAEHFNPQAYARIAEKDPHLLTGDAAVVGHVANGLPAAEAGGVGLGDIGPTALGVGAGELAGHAAGVPVVGGVMGALAGPMIRAKLRALATRGNPEAAAGAATDPALSYFYNQGRMPPGWNRAPSSPLPAPFGGYLPSPDMVNAGGGATTADTLRSLGLTPDVQAAGAAHPAAARLTALREQLSRPPMEEVPFQGPQKWGDFSIAPQQPPPSSSKLVDETGNPLVLYHGTNATFDTFDPARGQEYGIYLTPRVKYAGAYGPIVKAVHADIRNPLMVENKGEISPRNLTKEDIDGLRAQGYDGIVSMTPGQPVSKAHEVVAFAPEQVRPAGTPATAPAPPAGGIPFENVLEQGGTGKPPVGAPATSYRPPAKSPNQPKMRTPPGAPDLTSTAPAGPSPAQIAFRNKLAADRLRKVAGDLRLEGPGGATGDPAARLLEALQRRERGFAEGGEVPRGSSSPGSPGVSGAIRDAIAALRNHLIDAPRREIQAAREARENSIIDDTNTALRPPVNTDNEARGGRVGYAKGGSVKPRVRTRPIQEFPRDERGLFIEPDVLTKEIIVQIEHNRQRAANKAYYADKHCGLQKGYDPNGRNPCGECNQADGDHCLLVEDDLLPKLKNGRFPPLVIDRKKGSCGPWEIIDPNDPEQRGNRLPASIAGYGVRKGGGPDDAFGCHACWKQKKSKHPVLLDRVSWCGEWGTTVELKACCVVNGAPTEKRG